MIKSYVLFIFVTNISILIVWKKMFLPSKK